MISTVSLNLLKTGNLATTAVCRSNHLFSWVLSLPIFRLLASGRVSLSKYWPVTQNEWWDDFEQSCSALRSIHGILEIPNVASDQAVFDLTKFCHRHMTFGHGKRKRNRFEQIQEKSFWPRLIVAQDYHRCNHLYNGMMWYATHVFRIVI